MQDIKIKKKNKLKIGFLKKVKNFFRKNKNKKSLKNDIEKFLNKIIKNKLPLKIDEEKIIFFDSIFNASFVNPNESPT